MKNGWSVWVAGMGLAVGVGWASEAMTTASEAPPSAVPVGPVAWTPEVRVGDSREQALAALGAPSGMARVNEDWEIFFYERGKIDLKQGRVSHVDLISPEELASRKARAARAWDEYQQKETLRRAQARYEGEQRKQALQNDPDFLSLSYTEQAEGWRDFMRAYPDVPVGSLYQDVLEKARNEQAKAAEARRLAELEARVAEAETRAAEAERQAAEARRTIYYPPYYSVIPYPVPYVHPSPPPRPRPHPGGIQVEVTGSHGSATVQGRSDSTSRLPGAGSWPYNFGGTRSTIRLGRDAAAGDEPPRR